jgi:hypothetical protein
MRLIKPEDEAHELTEEMMCVFNQYNPDALKPLESNQYCKLFFEVWAMVENFLQNKG